MKTIDNVPLGTSFTHGGGVWIKTCVRDAISLRGELRTFGAGEVVRDTMLGDFKPAEQVVVGGIYAKVCSGPDALNKMRVRSLASDYPYTFNFDTPATAYAPSVGTYAVGDEVVLLGDSNHTRRGDRVTIRQKFSDRVTVQVKSRNVWVPTFLQALPVRKAGDEPGVTVAVADFGAGETFRGPDGMVWKKVATHGDTASVQQLASTRTQYVPSTNRYARTTLVDAKVGDKVLVGGRQYVVKGVEPNRLQPVDPVGFFLSDVVTLPNTHGCIILERGAPQQPPAAEPQPVGDACTGGEPAGTKITRDGKTYTVVDTGERKMLIDPAGALTGFVPHLYRRQPAVPQQPPVKVGQLVSDGNDVYVVEDRYAVSQKPYKLRRVNDLAGPSIRADTNKTYYPATVNAPHATASR